MKETDLAAVVILFHPDTGELKRNILSYIDEVETVVLVDNSETINPEIARLAEKWKKIIYMPMHGNQGIARALNQGIRYCLEKGFSWILTMDQDSRFLTSLQGYKTYISGLDNKNISLVCPTYSIEGEKNPTPPEEPYPLRKVIQSGNLIQGEIFRKLGGYQEKYFIDYVDYEYCMRSQKQLGCHIICIPEVVLSHQPGTYSIRKILGINIPYSGQSTVRYYYGFRNGLDYIWSYKDWKQLPVMAKGFIKALLLEEHKKDKLSEIACGTRDYLLKRWGVRKSSRKP